MRRTSVVAICVASMATAGCQRGLDTATPSPAAPTTSYAAPAPQPLALPDDFPADLYLPQGYDLRSMMDVDGTRVVGMRVHGDMATLFTEARVGMHGLGWRQTLAMQRASDGAMLSFEKGPRAVVLWFRPVTPGTVQLQLQLREDMRLATR